MTCSGGQLYITRPRGSGGVVTASQGSAWASAISTRRPGSAAAPRGVSVHPGRREGWAGVEVDADGVREALGHGQGVPLVPGAPPLHRTDRGRGGEETVHHDRPGRVGGSYRRHFLAAEVGREA